MGNETDPLPDSHITEALLGRLSCRAYHEGILAALCESDGEVFDLIRKEYERLGSTIQLLAAENQCSRAVLAALGSVVQNKTSEGFPGERMHGGSGVIDEIERLAAGRAREVFGARYANVQPHSGTAANQIVITAILEKGEKILSMGLMSGGHYSHGSEDSLTRKFYDVEHYYVDRDSFVLDYDAVRAEAVRFGPKLIICGASIYTRAIDFAWFRAIADEVGAYLLADISHISALVMAGAHQSPIDYAHFTTTSTYKPGGPRGGLILMGKDWQRKVKGSGRDEPLWRVIERATFPGMQGTPYLNNVAAKAVFFKEAMSEGYRARQFKVIENAKHLAEDLAARGYDVLTGGTDNHMVLVNAANSREGLTGPIAQVALERCGIVVDKCVLPFDTMDTAIGSGIRLGTPIVTRNGMGAEQMTKISSMIDTVLRAVKVEAENEYSIDKALAEKVRTEAREMCGRFPLH